MISTFLNEILTHKTKRSCIFRCLKAETGLLRIRSGGGEIQISQNPCNKNYS